MPGDSRILHLRRQLTKLDKTQFQLLQAKIMVPTNNIRGNTAPKHALPKT